MNLATYLSTILPFSLVIWLITVFYSSNEITQLPSPLRWVLSITVPIVISTIGFRQKSLSFSGLAVGVITGFVLTLSNYCFTAALLTFFWTSSRATKYKGDLKRRLEDHYKEGGQRNWVQVVCNGGVATELALFYLMERGCGETPIDFIKEYNVSWFAISVLGAIACANGDTWASELGSVLTASDPYLITSLRSVPKGTNGGVSLMGLIVSALGGIVVGLGFLVPIYILIYFEDYRSAPPQWPILLVGLFGGLFGSITDSVLGATLQYSGLDKRTKKVVENPGPGVRHISGVRLLDNHSVNLLSTLITAILSPYFAVRLWTYF